MGAKGLVWLKVEADALTGPTAKFFPPEAQQQLRERFEAKPGDLILIVADTQAVTSLALSSLRARLAAELELYDPKSFHYSWIVRFPLFAWDAEEGRFVAEHHPFTMPLFEDLHLLDSEPAKVRAQAYDLVVNGEEAGGGTIRVPRPGDPVQDLRPAGPDARAGPGEVRVPPRRPAQRRPAARRHRAGVRPAGHALFGPDQHPRLHRLPQDGQGDRPHDRGTRDRRRPAAQGAAHPPRPDVDRPDGVSVGRGSAHPVDGGRPLEGLADRRYNETVGDGRRRAGPIVPAGAWSRERRGGSRCG